MTETSYALVPAGWYPDPRGTKQRRWWDGNAWTHALEAPAEPVEPTTPAYANLPGPQVGRVPSPSAPTVRRALDAEPVAGYQGSVVEPQKSMPTRRQLRDAAAVIEAQRKLTEPAAPAPVYAMGPAVSATQKPHASFSTEQFDNVAAQKPAEQLTKEPIAVAKSPAVSTVAATSLSGNPPHPAAQTFAPVSASPVGATHTFTPVAAASAAAPVAAAPVAAAPPVVAAPVIASPGVAAPVVPAPVAAAPAVALPISALPISALPISALPISALTPKPTAAPAAVSMSAGPAYQPFGMTPKITTGTMDAPTSVNTASVWLLTVLPALALGVGVALIRFVPEFYTPFTQGALLFVFAIAGIALAVRDRRELTLRSHQSTASPAWILLTPLVYLIARAVHTKKQVGRGWPPAIVFVLLTAGAAATVYFSGLPIETFVVL